MTQAFLDANVAIYVAGRAHPLKEPCGKVVALVADQADAFVTDAKVLQELLHRYVGLRMWPDPGLAVFERFSKLMRRRVEPIQAVDVERAAALATQHPRLSARDLVHVAVMQRLGVTRVVSADRGFDQVADIQRLDPADVASWRESVVA
ncbi:MAG: type II toxin-antitoxin system VapC family toxin [Dehalococcoidia bacterium]